jgi:hypothetical protein
MPAIHPPRLKIQANELVQNASDPEAFCRSYHAFLDLYADRTFRPGKVGEPPPLLRAYQVPKPVSRAVDKELGVWAEENREDALNLADALWLQSFLEIRLTAASLIGKIDPRPVKHIFSRVETWIQPNTEERLVEALIYKGLERILIEAQDQYAKQVETWLRSRNLERNRLGLKASNPLMGRRDFEDYPMLFKRLNRLMLAQNKPLRNEILSVLAEMASIIPEETAFFLENALKSSGHHVQIAWYMRNSLNYFPAGPRSQLRGLLVG